MHTSYANIFYGYASVLILKVSAISKGVRNKFLSIPETKDSCNLVDFESVVAVCAGLFVLAFVSSNPCSTFLVPRRLMRCILKTVIDLVHRERRLQQVTSTIMQSCPITLVHLFVLLWCIYFYSAWATAEMCLERFNISFQRSQSA